MKKLPDFSFEKKLWLSGFEVLGIDEVGRGAFAGPVAVAGVKFDSSKSQKLLQLGINDSKKLTHKKREYLALKIEELSEFTHISFIEVPVINDIGIGKATFVGMKEVAEKFLKKAKTPHLLIDAFVIPEVNIPQKGIIRGDSLSISIAAASIIAKVARDKIMTELSLSYPQYEFSKNKGYGTLYHRNIIMKNGISPHHRTEFCRSTLSI